MDLQAIGNVLLIEDNPDHADIVGGVVAEALPEAELEWIDHGTRALERLQDPHRRLPDLVLVDLKLPGLGGVEVLRGCRAAERTRGLRMIVLTSSDAEEDRRAAEASGADAYLLKAAPASALGDRLRQTLETL